MISFQVIRFEEAYIFNSIESSKQASIDIKHQRTFFDVTTWPCPHIKFIQNVKQCMNIFCVPEIHNKKVLKNEQQI